MLRIATRADAMVVARLLDAFNREFDTPTPGPEVLAGRLADLLGNPAIVVLLAGAPPRGVAVVSLRPNVWFEGPVALLDELYVEPEYRNRGVGSALLAGVRAEAAARGVDEIEIDVDDVDLDAQRFYRRHGFRDVDPDSGDRSRRYRGPVVAPASAPTGADAGPDIPASSAMTEYE